MESGFDTWPSPSLLVADTVTVMWDEEEQAEEDTLNTCLQTPFTLQAEEAKTVAEAQLTPEVNSV